MLLLRQHKHDREEQSSAAKQCKKLFKSKRSDSFWKQVSSSNEYALFSYFLLRMKGFLCVVRFESKKEKSFFLGKGRLHWSLQ